MKHIFKYIIVWFCIFGIINPIDAQKKPKSKAKKVLVTGKSKKAKPSKKSKTKRANTRKKSNTTKLAQMQTLAIDNSRKDISETPVVKTIKGDSIAEKVVTILSQFKPQLKNVAKIGFINASIQGDTGSIKLDYSVPSQNLSFQYKPISLVPRAYKADSLWKPNYTGFVQGGFGNYLHRYLNADLNAIDALGNTHTLNINNEALNGLHHLQKMNDIGINYIGDINISTNNHIVTNLFYKQTEQYRYGLVPDASNYSLSNYKQNYYHTGIAVSLLNDDLSNSFVYYKPVVKMEHFEGLQGATNNWIDFYTPLYIMFQNDVKFNLNISYSYNKYNPKYLVSTTNTLLKFDPSLELDKAYGNFKIGVSPTFENSKFNLYPNIEFKKKLTDTNYLVIAGWNTQLINNQYSTLVLSNPWIEMPKTIAMTTHDKKYINIQINDSKRLVYGVGLSLNNYTNLPLFNRLVKQNTFLNGLMYTTLFEPSASTLELEGNLRYQFSDKLLVANSLKYIQFNSLEKNANPWGILPLEFESKLNWTASKKISLQGEVLYWSGATMQNEKLAVVNMSNTMVINAKANYKISENWGAWLKVDNLLDKPYERWSDYPSLGVQIITGVVYSFRK